MKKLLLLGGSRYLLPVIKVAKELGIYTITCDYLPDNVAHKYSNEYHNVSITDKEAVLALARNLKIDGVMSFACDPGVVTAGYVAEQLGLSGAGPYESVSILQNKNKFRAFLKEHGFNVPMAKGYTSIEDALKDTNLFHWPVIVKPTDSAGSKGVTKVELPENLRASIEYALQFSRGKEFIIEDFLEKKGCSSDSDCFSINGELAFVSFSAQRFDEHANNPYTPSAYSWPATISEKNQRELKSEIQRLLKLLNMQTSIYNVETRECVDGKAYIMEVSPRGGGNRLSEMLRYATGVDLIKNAVLASVGMPLDKMIECKYDGYWAEIILHSTKQGIFEKLLISEEIKDMVVETDLWVKQGDKVEGFAGANEAIGTLVLHFEKQEMLNQIMSNLERHIEIKVR